MKKYIAILSFALMSAVVVAQDFETPQRGAKIYAEDYVISLDANGKTTFDLWLVRSKYAKRADFETPKLITSSGLSFDVVQDEADKDHYTVTVSAENVAAGNYSTTVSSRSTGTQKVTGTTLTFDVAAAKAVASKDGE